MIAPNLSWRLGFYTIIGFWAYFALKTFPPPSPEDAWSIGAAVNLAQHGIFANPWCESLTTIGSSGQFLAGMPLHSYVLAGWLRLFGLSTLTVHLFYTLMAFLVTVLVYRLFPAVRSSWGIALLLSLAVYGLLAGVGLRPDSLGLVFLLAGLDAWRARTVIGFFVKNLFLGLAVITFPTVAFMAMMFALGALIYQRLFYGRTLRELIPLMLAGGTAYVLCFLLMLACIHGQLLAFLDCLSRDPQVKIGNTTTQFQILSAVGISRWIVVQLAFLLLIGVLAYQARAYYHRRERWFFLTLALLAFVSLGFASFISATGVHVWAFACLVVALYILMHEDWSWPAWVAFLLLFLVASLGHGRMFIRDLVADQPPGWEQKEALRAEVKQLHPARLYLDAYAMRELYSYRLPANTYCFETSNTTGWGQPFSVATMPPNSIAIVSVGQGFPTPRSPDAGSHGKPFKILGYPVSGVVKNPWQLELIDNRD